ncbi:MAG TPA: S49 family peptidase, partial [Alphaproteobacteria bacterium]|nr:S49 family peptidase [Alphaproteobacteria bacterium]
MSDNSWLKGRTVVYNPVPKAPPKPRRFHIGRILWTALKRTCIVIGAVVLFSAVIGVWSAVRSGHKNVPAMPDQMVLTLTLSGHIPEESGMSQYMALLNFRDEELTFNALVDAIERAAVDPHVKALAFKVSSAGYDISQLQEIRQAVLNFKATGKKTYIYSESYGGSGYGLGLYYLASAFDEIWMQPVGVVSVGGVSAEMPFFKDVMEKYGVEAQFFQRKEYKNAMEHLTSSKMSEASREETQGLIDNLATQLIAPIKADRQKIAQNFDGLLNLGMLTDDVALKSGLIDRMDYEDALIDFLDKAYPNTDLFPMDLYASAKTRDHLDKNLLGGKKVSVAVIHVDGMIVSGSSGRSAYGLESSMAGADDIAGAIKTAARDKKIKAIILRVNSPGGSPSASETIARAVHWAKVTKKKPVYVSMGAVAASGGYWISTEATKIYAMDSTLTGSIGVVGG